MFGDRAVIWPEYFSIILLKGFFACWMFACPADPIVVVRYGLTLCAFSYQRLFIYAFQCIYNGDSRYVLANTLCGVVCAFQTTGVLFGSLILFGCMALYSFVLKDSKWVGADITGGGRRVSSPDRDVYLFRNKSMRNVVESVSQAGSKIEFALGATGAAATHELRDQQHQVRWEIALQIAEKMCDCQECALEDAEAHHVQGLQNILARYGYSATQIDRILQDCGCTTMPSTSISLEAVYLNPNLAKLLDQVFLEYSVSSRALAGAPHAVKRAITVQELKRHTHAEDLWVAIESKVYDLTKFAKRHPGGSDVFAHVAGTDASAIWKQQHGSSREVRTLMSTLCIGELVDEDEGMTAV
jgi:cytochrome b involved in lipid metabolism